MQRHAVVRPHENLRINYMVYSITQTIKPHELGRRWEEELLSMCGISKSIPTLAHRDNPVFELKEEDNQ